MGNSPTLNHPTRLSRRHRPASDSHVLPPLRDSKATGYRPRRSASGAARRSGGSTGSRPAIAGFRPMLVRSVSDTCPTRNEFCPELVRQEIALSGRSSLVRAASGPGDGVGGVDRTPRCLACRRSDRGVDPATGRRRENRAASARGRRRSPDCPGLHPAEMAWRGCWLNAPSASRQPSHGGPESRPRALARDPRREHADHPIVPPSPGCRPARPDAQWRAFELPADASEEGCP